MITLKKSFKTYSFRYSFAVDGGAQGTIEAPFSLPNGAIVTGIVINVLDAVVGVISTVTVSWGCGSNVSGCIGATPEAALGTGVVLINTPSTPFVCAPGTNKPSITIGVADLTAGIFETTYTYIV